MSDRRLRELERRYSISGSKEDRKALNRARVRNGLPKLPRECIRHFVSIEHHGHVGDDGLFDIPDPRRGGWPLKTSRIHAACSVELWPRELLYGLGTMRKNIYYTEDPDEVTCKTCIRSINKPNVRVRYRTHYAPGSKNGRERGIKPVSVCGRDDSEKFTETFSWRMGEVNCPTCKRVMRRGHRASRKPRTLLA